MLSPAACATPVLVPFVVEPANGPGGMRASVVVDMTTRPNDFALPCNGPGTSSKDVLFQVELPTAMRLAVHLDDVPDVAQTYNFGIAPAPCSGTALIACEADAAVGMFNGRLEAGTYFVTYDSLDNKFAPTQKFTFDLLPTQAAPANDECATAQPLVFNNGFAVATGDTTYANNSNAGTPGGPSCDPGSVFFKDVAYTFTLSQAQDVAIEVVAPESSGVFRPTVSIQRGSCGPTATEVACDSELFDGPGAASLGSHVAARNLPPDTYYVWVDGQAFSAAGPFVLRAHITPPSPGISNDSCSSPSTLVAGASPVLLDLSGAGGDYDHVFCGDTSIVGGDAVYQFTLTQPQYVRLLVQTLTGTTTAMLELRSGTCGSGSIMGCQSNVYDNQLSRNLAAGTYYVAVKQGGFFAAQYQVSLTTEATKSAPANDTCAGATLIDFVNNPPTSPFSGAGFAETIDLNLATHDYPAPWCGSAPGYKDVVYKVIVPAHKRVSASASSKSSYLNVSAYQTCGGTDDDQCINVGALDQARAFDLSNDTGQAKTWYVLVQDNGNSQIPNYAAGEVRVSFGLFNLP